MQNSTDKDILIKGLKLMGITALLMFVGPTVVYVSLTDKTQAVFIPLISIGFIICGAAIYFGFKGIRTIMDSMFNKN
ncbi:hypothetical protein SAMN03097699_1358 [Flavobacteriaceae bacterium MAR_2010_188]|nr:hypothetical protein SAMN03097699_1358 [Flavobacteriaceae bacterium MAR_2010_188]